MIPASSNNLLEIRISWLNRGGSVMKEYDVIIVGSGLGGLLCGAILSREGYRVCLVEKNDKIGGALQTFVRDGVRFDVGVHYFGGFSPGQNLYQLFKYVGIHDKLKVSRLDENGFDRITFSGDQNEYPLSQSHNLFIQNLLPFFPAEEKALIRYIDKLHEMCAHFPLYNLTYKTKKKLGSKFEELNARDFIGSITSNQKLQMVLSATNPLYAGDAETTPFYLHALINNSYIESAWRCEGGGSQIATQLMKQIKQNGGVFHLKSAAKKFTVKNGMAEAVLLENGHRFEADHFISNVHPANTMEMIDPGMIRKSYRKRLATLQNTTSAFIVNAVLKKGYLKFWNYNRYYYRQDDVWNCHRYREEQWPMGLVAFMSSNKGPDGFAEGITLMSYMNYSDVERWSRTFNTVTRPGDRGKDYLEFKQQKGWRLIKAAEEIIPGLSDNIVSFTASSPLTFRDYLGTKDGSLYGVMKDCRNPLQTFISPRTKIPNLFLAGQNLDLHGILGVTISSILTCSEFMKTHALIDKILNS